LLDLQGGYRLALGDKLQFSIDLPTLKLRDMDIAPAKIDAPEPWIRLPLIEVSNSTFSLEDHKLQIGRIQIDRPNVNVWREMDGRLNLSQLQGEERCLQHRRNRRRFLKDGTLESGLCDSIGFR